MRWTRKSLACATIAVLLAIGIVGGTVWWLVRPQNAPTPPNPDPDVSLPEPAAPEQPATEPEVFSPHHLPGSWSFEDLDRHRTLQEWVEDKRPDVTASLPPALDELLKGKRPLETCALEVKWTEGGKGTSITIHGDGLGIHWQGKQFQVSAEQRLDLLRKLRAANFLAIPDHLGKLPKGTEPPKDQDRRRACGRIALRIGKESKIVDHNNEGPANEQLVRLAKDLLTTCLKHSASGIGVSSLEDGLQKVLDHKLDLRAMQVEVGFSRPANSYQLQIEGLSTRTSGMTYLKPFRGQNSLAREELVTFIKTVQREKFQELNYLHGGFDYFVTINVRVLNKNHSISYLPYHSERSSEEELRRFEWVLRATNALQPEHIREKKDH